MTDARRPTPPGEGLFLGIDLGGNHIKYGFGSALPELDLKADLPTEVDRGRQRILDNLARAVERSLERAEAEGASVAGIGVGMPGVVEPRTGQVLFDVANIPDWKGVDLPAEFRRRFGLPCHVENDANVATYAEYAWGCARGARGVVMVTVGTGIGGGAIVDGQLLRGVHGAGMELGHVPLLPSPEGNPDFPSTVEGNAGGRWLTEAWRRASGEADATLRDLIDRANGGEEPARRILERGADALGLGLAAALLLLNPDVLVLGGGILEGCAWFADRAEESMRMEALPKALHGLRVERARFGNWAGVIGAAALARAELGPSS